MFKTPWIFLCLAAGPRGQPLLGADKSAFKIPEEGDVDTFQQLEDLLLELHISVSICLHWVIKFEARSLDIVSKCSSLDSCS